VRVFVVDTGVRWGHDEFSNDKYAASRVSCGYDAFHVYEHHLYDWDSGCYDGVGHGTYVAAIIGGAVYVRRRHNIYIYIVAVVFIAVVAVCVHLVLSAAAVPSYSWKFPDLHCARSTMLFP
jgi:subtilisin family serine protease